MNTQAPRFFYATLRELNDLLPQAVRDRVNMPWHLNDAAYKAPEQSVSMFRGFQNTFEEIIGPDQPAEDWQIKAIALWMVKTEADVRAMLAAERAKAGAA